MGRPRKPTEVLEALGAFAKNPNRRRGNQPAAEGVAVKPKYLKGRASRLWDEKKAHSPTMQRRSTPPAHMKA